VLIRGRQDRHYDLHISPLLDARGHLTSRVVTMHDVTESKRAEVALRESEERYKRLSEVTQEGIALHDNGVLLDTNAAAERIFGFGAAELIGKDVIDLVFAPEDRDLVRSMVAEGREKPYEVMGQRKDGTVFPLAMNARQVQYDGRTLRVVSLRDITERKRLEQELVQAKKMEAIGRLAGGVAHDFNNLLTVISGYAEFILDALDPEDRLRHDVEQICRASESAASLIGQLLAFSRRQILEMQVLNLNDVLAGMGQMLHRIIGEDIHLEVRLASDLPSVRADPGQIEQVVVNLAVNARDAMPTGGTLTIETDRATFAGPCAARHGEIKPGSYLLLAVSDTGHGLTPEAQEHLFEPFFTTKTMGRGTGLGLSTVYGIVKQSGGYIHVYSEPDEGATFKIYLPQVDEEPESPPADGSDELQGGTETILVVEDQREVRRMAVRMLQRLGYAVLEASDGAAALRLLSDGADQVHLVLTDVVMPGVSGQELVDRLRNAGKDFQVIFMSGYTDDVIVHRGVLEPSNDFIEKPFSMYQLSAKVRQVLDWPR